MYMLMRKINNLQRDQAGFASIVIALVLILVLALLTVGFAELARREQQNALDKQLAAQAYYAAESGVNDISQVVLNAIANPATATPNLASLVPNTATPAGPLDPNKCIENQVTTDPQLSSLPSNNISSANGVSYSCVLLNLDPPSLVKTPLSANTAWTTTFATTGGGALEGLTINWSSIAGKPAAATAGGTFTPLANWNAPAVLQVSITPLGGILNRQSLINNTYTAYLYPRCDGPASAPYTAQQATVVDAKCNSGTYSVAISNLSGTPGESYAISILDYYDASTVSITNATDGTGPLDFSNSQALIDATGQAKNVLKRIQVHVPLQQPGVTPNYTVEAQNICKRFDTAPVIAGSNPGGTNFDGLDPSCDLE